MCLFTDTKETFEAVTDITVWKAVAIDGNSGNRWKGIYNISDETFPFDEVVEDKKPKEVSEVYYPTFKVGGGFFHSCGKYSDALRIKRNVDNAANWLLRAYSPTTAVFECVIPKGAEYYRGSNGEYASRKIKVISKKVLGRAEVAIQS